MPAVLLLASQWPTTAAIAALTLTTLVFLVNTRRANSALKVDLSDSTTMRTQRQLSFPDITVGNIFLLDRSSELGTFERAKKHQNVIGALSVPADSMIELADVPLTAAKSLEILSDLKPDDLAAITLTNRELTSTSINAINRLTGLQTLNLEGTNVDDSMLSEFKLPDLTSLNLKGTRLTDIGLGRLADSFPKLRKASFRDTRITDSGIADLLQKIQPIMLDLSETQITDQTLFALSAQPRLTELKMTATTITNDGLANLAMVKTLQTLGVCQTAIDDGAFDALCKMQHLTYLNINHTLISDDALLKIRQALPTCEIYK